MALRLGTVRERNGEFVDPKKKSYVLYRGLGGMQRVVEEHEKRGSPRHV